MFPRIYFGSSVEMKNLFNYWDWSLTCRDLGESRKRIWTMLRYGKVRIVICSFAIGNETERNNREKRFRETLEVSDTPSWGYILEIENSFGYLWNDCLKSALNFMRSSVIDPNCFNVISASAGATGLLMIFKSNFVIYHVENLGQKLSGKKLTCSQNS